MPLAKALPKQRDKRFRHRRRLSRYVGWARTLTRLVGRIAPWNRSRMDAAMAESPHEDQPDSSPSPQVAVGEPQTLPPYKVILHNDDVNEATYVVGVICKLTPLNTEQATKRMVEAHYTGQALLLVTHRERAELYQEQFASAGLTVTIEQE